MFNTSFLDDVPERPSNLLAQVKRGDQVVVCEEDSVVCGEHRGDGAFWYSRGTVLRISRKCGYVLVGYVSRYGNNVQRRFASNGYPLDETGITRESDRFVWYNAILLLLSPRLKQQIRHQELVDQIARRSWKDWGRLDDSMLEALHIILEAKREKAISEILAPGHSSLSVLAARVGSGWNSWKVWLEDRPEVWSLSDSIPFAITDLLLGLRLPRKPLSSGLKELHCYLQNHPERVLKGLVGIGLNSPDSVLFDRIEVAGTDVAGESPSIYQMVPTSGTLILLDRIGNASGSGELYALAFDDHFHLYEMRRPHDGVPVIQEVQFAELLAPFDGSAYRVVYAKTVTEPKSGAGGHDEAVP